MTDEQWNEFRLSQIYKDHRFTERENVATSSFVIQCVVSIIILSVSLFKPDNSYWSASWVLGSIAWMLIAGIWLVRKADIINKEKTMWFEVFRYKQSQSAAQ